MSKNASGQPRCPISPGCAREPEAPLCCRIRSGFGRDDKLDEKARGYCLPVYGKRQFASPTLCKFFHSIREVEFYLYIRAV